MTHTNTNAFTPAHGWIAVREMLATIAERFGDLAERDVHQEIWRRAVLHWLRPAEHLARLLLFVLARALPPRVIQSVIRKTRATQRAAGASGFRLTLPAPGPWRASRWKARPRKSSPRRERTWFEEMSRDREAEAEQRAARRASYTPPPERPAPPPRITMFPTAPLVARIAAISRVLADPDAAARRIRARLDDTAHTARLLAPGRILTVTPCFPAMLQSHDLAHAIVFPPDSS